MKNLIAALFLFALPTVANASPCDQFYPNGKEIVVPNTKVLCNSFYAIVYNDYLNANVFSTEVAQARVTKTPRTDDFRADKRIADSPTPADYTNTGYDRGHMVAAANADDPNEMSDTFLMTNMTPQLPSINRTAWRLLEDQVRDLPFKWVVTGAHYSKTPAVIGKAKVPVPDMLYKVVYLKDGSTIAYTVNNLVPKSQIEKTTVEALETKIGYKLR